MKFKKEHLDLLDETIGLTKGAFLRSAMSVYKEGGLSPKRFRWDALRSSGWGPRIIGYFYDLGEGYDDEHIDTALRAVMARRGLRWASPKSEEKSPPRFCVAKSVKRFLTLRYPPRSCDLKFYQGL